MLRTPLLPVKDFLRWSGNGRAGRGKDDLRRSLAAALDTPLVADSLRVASPALAENMSGWAERPDSRRRRRIERTVVQYFARMCDRCTPFGLFAGVSVGGIGEETRLRLAGRRRYRRRSALDLAQVAALLRTLLDEENVRRNLRYRPNDTLATVPGGYQYVEAGERGGETRHEVVFVEADEALDAAMRRAAGGALLPELGAAVAAGVSDPEVGAADIAEYLGDLIESQVIEPELIPAVVGADPLDQMLEILRAAPPLADAARRVGKLRAALDRLDARGVGASPEAYAAVNAAWTDELGQRPTDRLLQVDLFKESSDLRLGKEVVEEVLRGGDALWRLAGPAPDPLRDLKNRFRERYESREVPLAEAFDPEVGLGAPGPDLRPRPPDAPLLAGLGLGGGGGGGQERPAFPEALAVRLLDSGAGARDPLVLDDALLDRMASAERALLPDAFAVQFDLLAKSGEAVRRGDFRVFLRGAFGPSGARMAGRFCDLDPALRESVRDHLRDEEALAPDEVFAEIVHSPEGRVGNVVRRPHLREVELSVAGHSRREGANRLTVDDLLVRLEGGRFRLRSRRDGRTVRPRLTSAHNYRRSTGMYRFLGALQSDGTREGFGWNWGALRSLPFLPRVVRGRSVYALARWRVGRERPGWEEIGKAKTPEAREDALRRVLEELGLPRFARLADGDNRLLLDLRNPLSLGVLADHARFRPALTLEEALPEDLGGCVRGPEGKYRNEIILPFVRVAAKTEPDDRLVRPLSGQRAFPPGGEWLYLKHYCSRGTADALLREIAAPLAVLHSQVAPGRPWFFIRYSDPEPHLRMRFRADREALRALEERAVALAQPLFERGVLHRVSLDTYVRETERYGGDRGIELAEAWFRRDSETALRVLEIVAAAGDENLRWKAVAMGCDRLLADFGLDHEARERVVSNAREAFGQEFGVGPAARQRLAKRLRTERSGLLALVSGTPRAGPLGELDAAFRKRSEQTADIAREFRRLDEAGALLCSRDDLLRSLTHMAANRLLASSARAQELVIHDFLSRAYRSLIARAAA